MQLKLTNRGYCLIDEEDYDMIKEYKWRMVATGPYQLPYVSTDAIINGKRTTMYLHRLLMDHPKGKVIHHINGDGLDNRRSNLEVVSPKENLHYSFKKRGVTIKHVDKTKTKKKITFHIDDGDLETLKRVSAERNVPYGRLIRDAVKSYLEFGL